MLSWTVSWGPELRLTEGEEEGIKADLSAWRHLRDEPPRHAADGC